MAQEGAAQPGNPPDIAETLKGTLGKCLKDGGQIQLAVHGEGRPKREMAALHCHPYWELFLIEEGGFAFESVNMPLELFPEGSTLIVPPGCPHAAAMTLEQPPALRICVLSLPDERDFLGTLSWMHGSWEASELCALQANSVAKWSMTAGSHPNALLAEAAKACQEGFWGKERACSILRMLLASLGEALADSGAGGDEGQPDPRVLKVFALLHKEYYKPGLSAKELARRVGLSQAHLFDLFKSVAGVTMRQTLIDIRLRRAKELIEDGRYSIKEVASMTGWKSQLYLSSTFRARYGMPPSALRRKSVKVS